MVFVTRLFLHGEETHLDQCLLPLRGGGLVARGELFSVFLHGREEKKPGRTSADCQLAFIENEQTFKQQIRLKLCMRSHQCHNCTQKSWIELRSQVKQVRDNGCAGHSASLSRKLYCGSYEYEAGQGYIFSVCKKNENGSTTGGHERT